VVMDTMARRTRVADVRIAAVLVWLNFFLLRVRGGIFVVILVLIALSSC
jgi:hypothetical protein